VLLRVLAEHVPMLQGERSLRAANEVALGIGRLSTTDASSLIRTWSGVRARPQSIGDVVTAAVGLGFTVERDHVG